MNSTKQSKGSINYLKETQELRRKSLRDSEHAVIESTAESDGEMTATFPQNSRNPNQSSERSTSPEPKSTSKQLKSSSQATQDDPMAEAREMVEEALMELASGDRLAPTESTIPKSKDKS